MIGSVNWSLNYPVPEVSSPPQLLFLILCVNVRDRKAMPKKTGSTIHCVHSKLDLVYKDYSSLYKVQFKKFKIILLLV